VSELTDVIDSLTGELERFRNLHAETLIEHAAERDRWATRVRKLEAALQEIVAEADEDPSLWWAGEVARKALGLPLKYPDVKP
jgi:hypothetical protein